MSVSVHGGESWGVMVGLVSQNIFRQASPAFSCQLGFWVCLRTSSVAVVCRGFISVVLSDFSMVIVFSWIANIFINGRFVSARMTSTGVVRSWPVMAHPT